MRPLFSYLGAMFLAANLSLAGLPAYADPAAPTTTQLEALTLGDVRDVGMALDMIKQQAINIYAEAIRAQITPADGPTIQEYKTIPVDTSKIKILPARREWLVYSLASMEPVIRLLGKEVDEVQAGTMKVQIPAEAEKEINPLWEAWQKDVQTMNHHLDGLVPLFEDAEHKNAEVAKVAVEIFNDVARLENVRRSIYKIVLDIEKNPARKKIMVQE